jgi:hypothetical protein
MRAKIHIMNLRLSLERIDSPCANTWTATKETAKAIGSTIGAKTVFALGPSRIKQYAASAASIAAPTMGKEIPSADPRN